METTGPTTELSTQLLEQYVSLWDEYESAIKIQEEPNQTTRQPNLIMNDLEVHVNSHFEAL